MTPFIVGCARSGTSWLRAMLSSHSQVEVHGEDGRCLRGLPAPAAYDKAGKLYAGEKHPGYSFVMPHVERLFPDARFVHIIRDGVDVASSLLRVVPKYFPDAAHALEWWVQVVDAAQSGGAGVAHYHEVRYEALAADPAAALSGVCAFLGVDYEVGMLAYEIKAQQQLDAMSDLIDPRTGKVELTAQRRKDANQNLVLAPLAADRVGAGRVELPTAEKEKINAHAAGKAALERLGYQPEVA